MLGNKRGEEGEHLAVQRAGAGFEHKVRCCHVLLLHAEVQETPLHLHCLAAMSLQEHGPLLECLCLI